MNTPGLSPSRTVKAWSDRRDTKSSRVLAASHAVATMTRSVGKSSPARFKRCALAVSKLCVGLGASSGNAALSASATWV